MARPKKDIELKRNPKTGLWETHYTPPGKNQRRQIERWKTADQVKAGEKHGVFVEQLERGLLRDRDVTFGMLAGDYFKWCEENGRSPTVTAERQRHWKARLAPELASVRVADTNANDLAQFFERVKNGEAKAVFKAPGRAKRTLAPGAVGFLQEIVNSILGHAVTESQRLHHSLKPTIKMAKRPVSPPKAWGDHDAFVRIIEAAKVDRRLHLFTTLGLHTGQRSNVLYRLPWRLVDFNNRMVYFRQLKLTQRHERDRKRVVDSAMSDTLFATLFEAYQNRPDPRLDGCDLVLETPALLDQPFKAMLDALGLPGSPHWMRHTFVTSLRRQGVGFDDIAIMTGDDPRTLAKTYAWVQTPDVRRLYDLLPGATGSKPSSPSDASGKAFPPLRRVK